MKKFCFFLFLLAGTIASAQNTDYLVTFNGIGTLKVGMTQASTEKLLNKKFTLKNVNDPEGSWLDTVKTTYKTIPVTLYFERVYSDDNNFSMMLYGIMAASPLCKTKTGIGMGTDRMKIINDHEGGVIFIAPDFEDDTYTKRSKTKSSVTVTLDDSENMIVFHLLNKKVVGIEVSRSYGD